MQTYTHRHKLLFVSAAPAEEKEMFNILVVQ